MAVDNKTLFCETVCYIEVCVKHLAAGFLDVFLNDSNPGL